MPLGAGEALVVTILVILFGVCMSPTVLTGVVYALVMPNVGWRFAIPFGAFMGMVSIVGVAVVWGFMLNREHNTWANAFLNMRLVVVGCAAIVWIVCFLLDSLRASRGQLPQTEPDRESGVYKQTGLIGEV